MGVHRRPVRVDRDPRTHNSSLSSTSQLEVRVLTQTLDDEIRPSNSTPSWIPSSRVVPKQSKFGVRSLFSFRKTMREGDPETRRVSDPEEGDGTRVRPPTTPHGVEGPRGPTEHPITPRLPQIIDDTREEVRVRLCPRGDWVAGSYSEVRCDVSERGWDAGRGRGPSIIFGPETPVRRDLLLRSRRVERTPRELKDLGPVK